MADAGGKREIRRKRVQTNSKPEGFRVPRFRLCFREISKVRAQPAVVSSLREKMLART